MDDLTPKSDPVYTAVPIGAEALPEVEIETIEKSFSLARAIKQAIEEPKPPEEFTGKVLLSPTDTRGFRSFTEYVGSDPDSDVPGIRVDGWTDAEGVKWVRASATEDAELKVVFENSPYLPAMYLVRYDVSARVKLSARRVRRQRSEQDKRGL